MVNRVGMGSGVGWAMGQDGQWGGDGRWGRTDSGVGMGNGVGWTMEQDGQWGELENGASWTVAWRQAVGCNRYWDGQWGFEGAGSQPPDPGTARAPHKALQFKVSFATPAGAHPALHSLQFQKQK